MLTPIRPPDATVALLRRVWDDPRFQHVGYGSTGTDLRAFVTAFILHVATSPDASAPTWPQIYETAHAADSYRYGCDRWTRRMITADLPRYSPHDQSKDRGCPVLKTRGPNAGEPCGRYGSYSHRVTDETIGEWRIVGWCRTHRHVAEASYAHEQTLTGVPEPEPNTGGLLPAYLPRYDWERYYRLVDDRWIPPYLGCNADDWPILAGTIQPPVTVPTLTSVDGTREDPTTDHPIPALTLIRRTT